MKCKNCGSEIENDAKFCNNCGSKVNDEIVDYSSNPMNDYGNNNNYVNNFNYSQNNVTQPSVSNVFAIIGFILALLGVDILGLIISIVGLVKSKTINKGKGLAIAGIILAVLKIVFSIIFVIWFVSFSVKVSNYDENETGLVKSFREEYCSMYTENQCTLSEDGSGYDCDEIYCPSEYISTESEEEYTYDDEDAEEVEEETSLDKTIIGTWKDDTNKVSRVFDGTGHYYFYDSTNTLIKSGTYNDSFGDDAITSNGLILETIKNNIKNSDVELNINDCHIISYTIDEQSNKELFMVYEYKNDVYAVSMDLTTKNTNSFVKEK